MEFVAAPPVHRVLCADCGTLIEPNSANLCIACLRNSVDITEGIPKQGSLSFCRNCERFLSPPSAWTIAEPESRELLAICLKKLKGLNKVRLIDSGFIWTEPHSKRIKVKLTIQKEVFTSTILQQVFQVEFIVQYTQCSECARLAAKNTWKALVQVRQKVSHKRTFLFLEQLILKHGAQKETISVKEVRDGLDFFYSQRSHALRMTEFLNGVVPVRTKSSERLLSTDTHSNTSSYKFTYSVEIAPICKDDLVCLPLKQARSLSNISPLALCTRVGNSIHLLDPATLQSVDVSAQVYWRAPFEALAGVSDLVEFTVLDVEPSGPVKGKWVLADAQVAVNGAFRSSSTHTNEGGDADMDYDDDGTLDQIFHTRTHLGGILQPGDTVLGYHLSRANFNSDAFTALPSSRVPDVVLVRKTYPNRRKKNKPRAWRLKSMAKEEGEEATDASNARGGVIGRMGGRDQKKVEEDYELFLRDIEEDEETRAAVNLYKRPGAGSGVAGGKTRRKQVTMDVDMEEQQEPTPEQPSTSMEAETDGEEEPDFPEVKLDELLDDFDEMTLGDQQESSNQ
ncbi:NMD3-domain-containing protein [Fomitiporia mediterranea MF3/22]|uniref:NMD3-domain-containing protein n=1 Tax=Fomitiporia mediterranea (strain MF3/22) TaxID=694068 RepID=UPI0004407F67|nr:NMD3-domain-containing protein [Fomitiporia mediterranea MF3/22]EJC99301.1 NMD3-domain-containing protein [Fomitiporia mediterranea MF3/22]